MLATPLTFSDALTARAYRDALAKDGRVQIADALTRRTADVILHTLKHSTPWQRSISVKGQGREVPVEQFDGHGPEAQNQFFEMVWSEARFGFQYLFDRYRFWDLQHAGHHVSSNFSAIEAMLNAPESIEVFRALTGDRSINFVDAQATRYLPGHFLTQHDDGREQLGRRYAYVLNLSEAWRADWGGLLLFHGANTITGGFIPVFNSLNVFRVPQSHSVSVVAPYSGGPRLSITGWMRAGSPEAQQRRG